MGFATLLHVLGFLLSAMLLGAMLLFATVITPLIFRNLPTDIASDFIRRMFPVYYDVLMGVTGVAAACLWPWPEAPVMAGVALLFVFARWVVMPRMVRARDLTLLGDPEEEPIFRRLHRISVAIAVAQMAALLTVFLRLAIA